MRDQATRLRELAQNPRQAGEPRTRQVITVTSGKGGVGKSTLALNLSLHLAAMGARVLLVDGDANLGSLDVMLGLSPRFRLSHVLRGERDIEDVLVTPAPRLMLLPAASGETDAPPMSTSRQRELLEELLHLEQPLDVLVFDTAAGIGRDVMVYAEAADTTLVVSTPEPTSVMDAYALMKVLWSEHPEADVRLVVSGARQPGEAEEIAGKLRMAVAHFLKRELPYAGVIPYDPAVRQAVVDQRPLAAAFPRCAASLSIQALARGIASQSTTATERRRTTA